MAAAGFLFSIVASGSTSNKTVAGIVEVSSAKSARNKLVDIFMIPPGDMDYSHMSGNITATLYICKNGRPIKKAVA